TLKSCVRLVIGPRSAAWLPVLGPDLDPLALEQFLNRIERPRCCRGRQPERQHAGHSRAREGRCWPSRQRRTPLGGGSSRRQKINRIRVAAGDGSRAWPKGRSCRGSPYSGDLGGERRGTAVRWTAAPPWKDPYGSSCPSTAIA